LPIRCLNPVTLQISSLQKISVVKCDSERKVAPPGVILPPPCKPTAIPGLFNVKKTIESSGAVRINLNTFGENAFFASLLIAAFVIRAKFHSGE
jgi:hypothetical protein